MYKTTPPSTIAEQQPTKPLQGKAVGVGHNRRKFSNHIYRKAYIMNMPINHGKEWTKQDDKSLLRFKKAEHTNEQIAHYLGRSEYAIECRLAYLKEKEKPIITRENVKKYLDILHAFNKGETIEMLFGTTWLPTISFTFSKPIENYRVKPAWCRVAKLTYNNNLLYTSIADSEEREKEIEKREGFVCWITERIEYT